MDIQQLNYFIAVAKSGHMTKVAKDLFISQPALSSSIARLEKEVGTPLFVRSGRKITMNDAGRIFLEFATKTTAEYQQTLNNLANLAPENDKTIRFGSSSQRPLSDNFGDMCESRFNFKIVYYNYKPDQLTQMLLEDKLDLCIASPPINCDGVHTELLCEEEILIGVSKKSKFANRSSICLYELKDEPFIGLNNDFEYRMLCEGFCKQAGFMPRYSSEVNFSTMREINKNSSLGENIVFTPKAFGNSKYSSSENQVFLHVDDVNCVRKIGLSWREGRIIGSNMSARINCRNEKYSII